MRKPLLPWLLACAACGGGAPPTAAPAPLPAPTATTPAPTATPTKVPPTVVSASPTPAPAPKNPWAGTLFPPANVTPPHERSAQPGDGEWRRMGDAKRGERAAEDPAAMFRATVHPHPISKWVEVTAVAMDLKLLSLSWVPGTDDPESDAVPKAQRGGTVHSEHQDTVVAAFNGGWQAKHGRWGAMERGNVYLPPREEGCTIAIYLDGRVRIASWSKLSGTVGEMVAYRQTPPCMLEDGALHPELEARNERRWGGLDPKRKTRRRSAIAIDASGRVLMYGYGDEAGARELALGLKALGASAVAELDINYHWVRFLLLGKPKPDAELQVTSTLIAKMPHRKHGYVSKPEPRDFFYVARRR